MSRAFFSFAVRASLAFALCASSVACAPSRQQKAKDDMAAIERETTPIRLQRRGEAAAMGGDFTRAEQYFVAAIKAGGDQRLLTKRLIVVCVNDARYPAAASYGEDYLRAHPSDTDVRYAIATVYIGVGELAHARDELTRVVHERPEIADAHYALASVLREQGDALLDADLQFREYIRLEPNGQYAEAARASLLKSVP
jgi:tetratricopeptide (TPR) repeat protein